jgi:hypothetical protein
VASKQRPSTGRTLLYKLGVVDRIVGKRYHRVGAMPYVHESSRRGELDEERMMKVCVVEVLQLFASASEQDESPIAKKTSHRNGSTFRWQLERCNAPASLACLGLHSQASSRIHGTVASVRFAGGEIRMRRRR